MNDFWDLELLQLVPTKYLLHLHRTLCGLRGRGWGRMGPRWARRHTLQEIHAYHFQVMASMKSRGIKVDDRWSKVTYRGKKLAAIDEKMLPTIASGYIFPEHTSSNRENQLKVLTWYYDHKATNPDELALKTKFEALQMGGD